jgi:hypothetical protein
MQTIQEVLAHNDVTTMMYIHVLNHRPAGPTPCDIIRDGAMPIRIKRRDKPRDRAQPTEDKELSAPFAIAPMACYAGRKPKLRTLCGSI